MPLVRTARRRLTRVSRTYSTGAPGRMCKLRPAPPRRKSPRNPSRRARRPPASASRVSGATGPPAAAAERDARRQRAAGARATPAALSRAAGRPPSSALCWHLVPRWFLITPSVRPSYYFMGKISIHVPLYTLQGMWSCVTTLNSMHDGSFLVPRCFPMLLLHLFPVTIDFLCLKLTTFTD